jgi:large subunit ribosomal protein L11
MQFCKDYNARTATRMGEIVPAEITVFQDGSFKFVLKSPPTSFLIKKAAGISKAASNPATETAATLTRAQVREIAEAKIKDMNAIDIEGAMLQVEGTARQMGIKVADK